jgi:hypothetical protein
LNQDRNCRTADTSLGLSTADGRLYGEEQNASPDCCDSHT